MVSIYSIQEGGNSNKTRIERQFFQVLSRFLAEKKLLSSELYFVPKRAILNVVKKNKNLVANCPRKGLTYYYLKQIFEQRKWPSTSLFQFLSNNFFIGRRYPLRVHCPNSDLCPLSKTFGSEISCSSLTMV
jgi:hypothetical protein